MKKYDNFNSSIFFVILLGAASSTFAADPNPSQNGMGALFDRFQVSLGLKGLSEVIEDGRLCEVDIDQMIEDLGGINSEKVQAEYRKAVKKWRTKAVRFFHSRGISVDGVVMEAPQDSLNSDLGDTDPTVERKESGWSSLPSPLLNQVCGYLDYVPNGFFRQEEAGHIIIFPMDVNIVRLVCSKWTQASGDWDKIDSSRLHSALRSDAGFSQIIDRTTKNKLRSFVCYGTPISDEISQIICDQARLTSLRISHCQNLKKSHFNDETKFKLENLELVDCPNMEMPCLSSPCMENLRSLRIEGREDIGDDGFENISRLRKLQTLNLGNKSVLGDDQWRQICELTRLQSLTLSDFKDLKDSHLAALVGLKLKNLELRDCPMVEKMTFLLFQNLSSLSIESCGIGDEALKNIAGLNNLCKLSLSIRCGQFSLEGACQLAACSSLQELSVDVLDVRNFLPSSGDKWLEYIAALGNLQKLILSGYKAADEGLKHLQRLKCLQKLKLSGCFTFTFQEAQDLVEELECLEWMVVWGSPIDGQLNALKPAPKKEDDEN